jgi:hypothetical protein
VAALLYLNFELTNTSALVFRRFSIDAKLEYGDSLEDGDSVDEWYSSFVSAGWA